MAGPGEPNDGNELKRKLLHCRSPQFLFQQPYHLGSTGKMIQGKVEVARLNFMSEAETTDELRKLTLPEDHKLVADCDADDNLKLVNSEAPLHTSQFIPKYKHLLLYIVFVSLRCLFS